jgi:hypothetical protein
VIAPDVPPLPEPVTEIPDVPAYVDPVEFAKVADVIGVEPPELVAN